MIYEAFKKMFLGIAMLAPLTLAAQEYDEELQMSTDIVYWYRICSAVPGMEGYAMTDLLADADCEEPENAAVYMMPTETDDFSSQWKLTAGEDDKIIITNRASGRQLNSTSYGIYNHNITMLTGDSTPGFTITSLGDYAFKLESVEDDGVNRCLALADRSAEAITYPEAGESTSAIGWKFFPVEIDTGIGSMQAGRMVVQVMKGRIFVKGCPEWQLFNASGEEMPRTVALPTGVYLVKTQQRTVKVLVP